MRCLIILLFSTLCFSGFGALNTLHPPFNEEANADSLKIWEKLNIKCDAKINDLLAHQAEQAKKSGTTSGYRLQLYFGSGENAHNKALKIKTEFLAVNPEIKAYLLFKSPDFIVRVGNWRTKSEALKMRKSLTLRFPNAFIVADDIVLPELNNHTN